MVTRLGQHIGQSASEAERKRASPAEAAAFRARVAELLAQERDAQQAFFSTHTTPGWRPPLPKPQPWVWTQPDPEPQQNQADQRTEATSTPSSSSSGQPAQVYTAGDATLTDNSGAAPLSKW